MASRTSMDASKRFKAEAVSSGEWKQWLEEQVKASAAGGKSSDGDDLEVCNYALLATLY